MNVLGKLSGKMGITVLKAKKAAPTIMVVGGCIGFGVSFVMGCKATLKAEKIIDDTKEKLDKIEEAWAKHNPEVVEDGEEPYTEKDKKKDTTITYFQAGVSFIKLYGPAVAIGMASIMSILGSHKIMRNRNIALAAAYGILERGFNAYRDRVKSELGDNLDSHFLHGVEDTTIETTVVDESTGKEKKKKVKGLAIPTDYELYGMWFDKSCTKWENNKDYNLLFLKLAEEKFNDLLQTRGYVFLGEVWEELGVTVPREDVIIGQSVGWLKGHGDDYVDFRIFNNFRSDLIDEGSYYVVRKMPNDELVYGNDIFLDFNVDGPILEYI